MFEIKDITLYTETLRSIFQDSAREEEQLLAARALYSMIYIDKQLKYTIEDDGTYYCSEWQSPVTIRRGLDNETLAFLIKGLTRDLTIPEDLKEVHLKFTNFPSPPEIFKTVDRRLEQQLTLEEALLLNNNALNIDITFMSHYEIELANYLTNTSLVLTLDLRENRPFGNAKAKTLVDIATAQVQNIARVISNAATYAHKSLYVDLDEALTDTLASAIDSGDKDLKFFINFINPTSSTPSQLLIADSFLGLLYKYPKPQKEAKYKQLDMFKDITLPQPTA